ncbi:MAG: FliM/FliN family flagellar motor switch protein [Gammaproteobacteria bacterium]|nr:FliM/FliN family flagellar motor switch protein [Gammaproteobacteria bacterium]
MANENEDESDNTEDANEAEEDTSSEEGSADAGSDSDSSDGVDENATAENSDEELADAEVEINDDTGLNESDLLDVTDPAVGIYEHLPVFDMYLSKLSEDVAVSISDYVRSPVELIAKPPKIGKFDPIKNTEEQPQFNRLFRLSALNGLIGVAVPHELVFRLVDIFFGGAGDLEGELESREFSFTENGMIDKLSEEIIDAIKTLLKTKSSLENSSDIEAWDYQKAVQAGRVESMVIISFSVTVGEFETSIELWFSLAVLELLLGTKLLPIKDGSVREPNWSSALKEQVTECELELKCALAEKKMPLRTVSSFKTGDFIPLDDVSVALFSIESVPLFRAKVGVSNEQLSASFQSWV